MKNVYQIKDILPKILKKMGLESEIQAAFIVKTAQKILDEKKIEATAFRFKEGDLFLKVKSAAQNIEVLSKSSEIVETINKKIGKKKVKRIKTRISFR